jgi:hypothetical protein
LSGLTHWLDYALWPSTPLLMHLHSLLWFAAAVIAATFLYRRILSQADTINPAWTIGLAAFMFAVSDAHGAPAAWLANRYGLVTLTFGLLTLIAHDRWRRDGWNRGGLIAPFTFLLCLLSSEGGVAAGAFLFAYSLFLEKTPWQRRLAALVPYAAIGIAWSILRILFGFGVIGSAMYVDPGTTPLAFVRALVERAPILLWGIWYFPPPDIYQTLSRTAVQVFWGVAATGVLLALFVLTPLLRADRVARFWAFGAVLAVIPSCAMAFPSNRLLLFAVVGGLGVLAQFLAGVYGQGSWLPRGVWSRRMLRAVAGLLVAIHIIVAPLLLGLIAFGIAQNSGAHARLAQTIPLDPGLKEQTLLFVNSPTGIVTTYGLVYFALNKQPVPRRALVLGASICPVEVQRVDERTLAVRPDLGFLPKRGSPCPTARLIHFNAAYSLQMFDSIFRDDSMRMHQGDRFTLSDVVIEVTRVSDEGNPLEVVFHFAHPLEDSSYRWLQWTQTGFGKFVIPAVGETVILPGIAPLPAAKAG